MPDKSADEQWREMVADMLKDVRIDLGKLSSTVAEVQRSVVRLEAARSETKIADLEKRVSSLEGKGNVAAGQNIPSRLESVEVSVSRLNEKWVKLVTAGAVLNILVIVAWAVFTHFAK